jgi:hypothetical protein
MDQADPPSSRLKALAKSKAVSAQSIEVKISLHRQQFAMDCQARLLSRSSAQEPTKMTSVVIS